MALISLRQLTGEETDLEEVRANGKGAREPPTAPEAFATGLARDLQSGAKGFTHKGDLGLVTGTYDKAFETEMEQADKLYYIGMKKEVRDESNAKRRPYELKLHMAGEVLGPGVKDKSKIRLMVQFRQGKRLCVLPALARKQARAGGSALLARPSRSPASLSCCRRYRRRYRRRYLCCCCHVYVYVCARSLLLCC